MKRFRFNLRSKKTAFVAAAAVVVLGLGVLGYKHVAAGTQDCSSNSIITCGAQTPKAFISTVEKNNDKDGHHDLKAVYSDFGLVPSDYSKFVTSARMGMAYQNGTVVVDGQTVATNAWSIGRTNFGYTTPYKINGKTYWKAPDTRVLLSNIPVMVLFNSKGQMQFAAMTACGNPVGATRVAPKYACDLLNKTHVSGNTYSFSTKASASRNAKVEKVVYNFGDGSKTVTETSLSKKVQHTYTKSGTFTAKVTVYVSLPGKQTVTVTSAHCQAQIKITPPPKPFEQCVNLTSTVTDQKNNSYKFVANTKQGNGATLKDASFDFGDGSSAKNIKPSSKSSVTANHSYTKSGNFDIKAVVDFNTSNGMKSANCETKVTIKPQPKPFQQCVGLDALVTDREMQDVKFTVTTKQGNGSTLKSADFDFGDGSSAKGVKPASDSTVVTNHTFAKTGTFTIVATVHFNTPNGVTNENCQTHVGFQATPAPVCDGLEVTKLGGRQVDVLVHYTADGAMLQSVTYNFGDGSQPKTDSSNEMKYTYANDGDYTITAALTFQVNGKQTVVSGENCQATVSFTTPPTCTAPNGKTYPAGSEQCTPAPTCTDVNGQTHPAGSEQCKTCTAPNGQTYQAGDERCQPQPTTLVNTGPGGIAGLFAGATAIGAIAYRWFVGRKLIRG